MAPGGRHPPRKADDPSIFYTRSERSATTLKAESANRVCEIAAGKQAKPNLSRAGTSFPLPNTAHRPEPLADDERIRMSTVYPVARSFDVVTLRSG